MKFELSREIQSVNNSVRPMNTAHVFFYKKHLESRRNSKVFPIYFKNSENSLSFLKIKKIY